MFYDMNITSKQKTTATAFAGDVAHAPHRYEDDQDNNNDQSVACEDLVYGSYIQKKASRVNRLGPFFVCAYNP